MADFASLLRQYLTPEETHSLIYNLNYNDFPSSIDKTLLTMRLVEKFNQLGVYTSHAFSGGGSMGQVFSIHSPNLAEGILRFKESMTSRLFRERESSLPKPNHMAMKIQGIPSKYMEARMMREEYIMNELSKSDEISKFIPKFYYGCTLLVDTDEPKHILGIRVTFMDYLQGIPLKDMLTAPYPIPDQVFQNIEKLVITLWKYGLSHIDISINNILIDTQAYNAVKLLDFGLSTITNNNFKKDIGTLDPNRNSIQRYIRIYRKHFNSLPKNEQHGSNADKLNEVLLQIRYHQGKYR